MANLVICVDAERIGTHYCNQNDELLGKLLPLVDKYRDGALSEQEQETIREAFDFISENDIEYYKHDSISGVKLHAGKSVKSLSGYWLYNNTTKATVEHEDGEYCIVSYFKWPGKTLTVEGFISKAFVESKLGVDLLMVPFASYDRGFFNTIKYDGKEVEYNTDAGKSDTYQLKIYKRSADNKFVEVVNFDFLDLSGCATLEVEGTEIGRHAYENHGFVRVAIPEGVTSIKASAFRECVSLKSVTIPATVTEIVCDAFNGCTSLTSVVIPASVTEIGMHAFEKCVSLKSVTIPASVTVIDSSAFKGCTGLTSIEIPKGVAEIRWTAFFGCTGLTSITIPESVTKIYDCAFKGCTGLTSIVVAEGNSVYDSRENCNAIIETATNKLVAGCSSTVIPASVTEIAPHAFGMCVSLKSVTIPASVTKIYFAAFAETGLTSIEIPASVTVIGEWAFLGCTALTSVTILQGVKKIEDKAFKDCTALETITLPAGIAKIDKSAFENCTALKTIYVPANKVDYYLKRLPWTLHRFVVEQEPLKKAKK